MPSHVKKATKKFEKNHLKDTLGRRKEFAKIKQRHQLKEKKKSRRAKEHGATSDEGGSARELESAGRQEKQALQDATMDDFFQDGLLDILKPKEEKEKGKASKRKRSNDDEDHHGQQAIKTAEDAESESGPIEPTLHKGDLDALAENDPEFYKYLQENDAELLDFDDEDDGGLDLSESDEKPTKKKQKRSPTDRSVEAKDDIFEVTLSKVRKWKTAMETQHSLRATKELVLAFRAAVTNENDSSKRHKYTIPTAEVYNELLVTALSSVFSSVLARHLPTSAKSNKLPQITSSKKFRVLSPLLNSYAQSLITLVTSLSDDSTVMLTLSSIDLIIPYILSFKKLLKLLTKSILSVWAAPATSLNKPVSEKTRLTAFLLLRTLAKYSDPGLLTALLKSTYQSLITAARITNANTLSTINLLKNSAAGLWIIDPSVGFTTGFESIRALAILLRGALSQPSKESHAKIYNWQFVHCLDFWSRVLSSACSLADPTLKKPSDSPFHPLIYPLVQISLGALNLLPTPTYFPLHFHIVRALIRISRQTGTYIPLFPPLLAILRSPTCAASPKATTLRPIDFRFVVRAPAAYLKTRVYQNGVGVELVELIGEYFGAYCKNIAYPELCIPPVGMMKRWLKDVSKNDTKGQAHIIKGKKDVGNKNQRFNAQVVLLVQKLNANASFVEEKRRKIKFAPSDREEVEKFLQDVEWEDMPLGAYLAARRVEKEERERIVDEARREEKEERNEGKGLKEDVEVSAGSEAEEEEEEEEEEAEDEN